ncbi:hypothetical protein [Herbidospora cretacea]|uniref:hypothetical protein n=1 Tax=Herbidospora cretacea TaxID=28444 RepID=UPI0004C2F732|nr:hypothetical protein [Herbidospora cretacea]
MARLIKRVIDSVKVESHKFMIMDDDGAENRPLDEPSMDDVTIQLNSTEAWIVSAANITMVKSDDNWHIAEVTLERWDEEPPADPEEWTKTTTTEMSSSSGVVRLVQILGDQSRRSLDFKEQAATWTVRASVRPGEGWRKSAGRAPRGIEAYRFQFWRAS